MKEIFKIESQENTMKITNASDCDIVFSWKPIHPKRKIHSFLIVTRKSFLIIEYKVDLSTAYISFQKTE